MSQLAKSRKGQLGTLTAFIYLSLGVLVVGTIMALSALFLANIAANPTVAADTNASTVLTTVKNENVGLASWVGIAIIVGVIVALLGAVLSIVLLVQRMRV